MNMNIVKLFAIVVMCFMIGAALVACGSEGPQGPQGPQGEVGPQGPAGTPGADGGLRPALYSLSTLLIPRASYSILV